MSRHFAAPLPNSEVWRSLSRALTAPEGGDRGAAVKARPIQDPVDVVFDGGQRDAERQGDVAVAQARSDQPGTNSMSD